MARILITSGPTRQYLDPVRYLTNSSSGRMGRALAQAAIDLGHDVIVVSGDLTQRAKREQFRAAREFLEQLPDVPRVVVPGNHDVPLYRVLERITNPLGLYRELISHELDQVLRVDGATIVARRFPAAHG